MHRRFAVLALVFPLLAGSLAAQEARVRAASEVAMPLPVDSNSPAFWREGRLQWFGSHGRPWLSEAKDQFGPWTTRELDFAPLNPWPHWLESVWQEDNGVLWGWYHCEPLGLVEGTTLTAPKIGAVVSFDGGTTLHDLGIVLESGDPLDPNSKNGYFAGGHGDFSVILDRQRKYFYFLFDNYGGDVATQGVVVARMAYEDRFNPVGKVWKYHRGAWQEPGRGGRVTPILPVRRAWNLPDPDAFWGPSVHFNTHLNGYVMLLNRAAGEPGWSQEGVYVSFASDLGRPEAWSEPARILDKSQFPGWYFFYPQVMGLEPGGTDTRAGATARLYVGGVSRWEIDFIARPAAPAGPVVEVSPATGRVKAGATVLLAAHSAGSPPFVYQWFKDGVPLPDATGATLTLAAAGVGDAGVYVVTVSNALGVANSAPVTIAVEAPPPPPPPPVAYLTNLSVRATLAAVEDVLTLGFVTQSPDRKRMLVRAVGPALEPFGVSGWVEDPRLEVFDAFGTRTAANDDWLSADSAEVAAAGAFPLPEGSTDASVVVDVSPGPGTAQVRATTPGTVLVELYDPAAARGSRLVNASVRSVLGAGPDVLVGGFSLGGKGNRRLLIRAAGPMLSDYGVGAALPDPMLEIRDAAGLPVAENDDWDAALAPSFARAGASPFAAGSRDAAVEATLAGGRSYTVVVRGRGDVAGEVMLEIFELP